MTVTRHNRDGIKGMFNPSRYGWERIAYWIQRLSGLGLLAFLVGHVLTIGSIVDGKGAWTRMLVTLENPLGDAILVVVMGLAIFHTINGIRVILNETGIGIGSPTTPEYPYKPRSLNFKQRLCIWVSIALGALAMLYTYCIIFGGLP